MRKALCGARLWVSVSVLIVLASFSASPAAHAQSADLAVVKSALGGSPVTAGTNLTWWIHVENAGPDSAATVGGLIRTTQHLCRIIRAKCSEEARCGVDDRWSIGDG
jgi:hypothetical protein